MEGGGSDVRTLHTSLPGLVVLGILMYTSTQIRPRNARINEGENELPSIAHPQPQFRIHFVVYEIWLD